MRHGLGFALVLLGIAAADSDVLFIPAAMIAIGALLLKDVIFDEG